ncbi:ATP-dependent RNA helicase dbp7 [Drechslerella dactyloides]|uniref:ATP-dependent RNA helicase n=1 Tax=Drechslerella dactyloides TaxID=74499 RepID=A0AAD6NHZ2_DREDA|nr:ATP-dependent RNA helicase dbp7 [Drechslerella dactyloides]
MSASNKYKPTEHDGLKEDGTPDKRVNPEHGFGGQDREQVAELGRQGGKTQPDEIYKPSEHGGLKKDGTVDNPTYIDTAHLIRADSDVKYKVFRRGLAPTAGLHGLIGFEPMAEPDLLVNFDLAPAGQAFTASSINGIRGGRWKDRFRAKKRLQYKRNKSDRSDTNVLKQSKESSRPRHTPAEAESNSRHRSRTDKEPNSTSRPQQDRPVVSSIFSSNPLPVTKPDPTTTANTAPAAPTNAPLQDGSAFATMGLAPTLASHLVNTMKLKAPTSIQQTAIPQLISSDSDAFIQAETGSGKTLTYLLPIVHRILAATLKGDKLHRDSGCFAVVLAPTRELGRQIYTVLMQLLSHPSLHWLVPILILGGEKKKSEKARIRKGGNILVATPGRLADHLVNTSSLDVGYVKWLVLDEGDRLMDLGFEETLQQILTALNQRAQTQPKDQSSVALDLPERRITVLCSATMKPSVQKLGDMSLKDALYLKSMQKTQDNGDEDSSKGFQAPAQLKQAYIVVPAKLRLVSLASILRRAFVRKKENMKLIVFFSCADSVDFHYEVFGTQTDDELEQPEPSLSSDDEEDEENEEEDEESRSEKEPTSVAKRPSNSAKSKAPLIDSAVSLFKLHGSLAQHTRTATLNDFFHEKDAAVLFLQYDPPYSKEDYIHRIGRTARAGREGRAILFLMPGCEEGYPSDVLGDNRLARKLADEVLKKGFGDSKPSKVPKQSKSVDPAWKKDFMPKTSGQQWEQEAIEFHLNVERRVLASGDLANLARKAFQSHIRAYATHIASERGIFDIKQLHLGHLAKSFGLRERPGDIKVPIHGKTRHGSEAVPGNPRTGPGKRSLASMENGGEALYEQDEEERQEATRKMRKKMKEHMNIAAEFNFG